MSEINKALQLLESEPKATILKFECSDECSDQLSACICKQQIDCGMIFREDSLYEHLNVKQYLQFFVQLYRHGLLYEEAVQRMCLHDLLHISIKKLNGMQRKRIAIAREIIHDPELFFLQEPLKDVDDPTCQMILSWLDTLQNFQKRAILTSMSLKQLYLIEGKTWYLSADQFQMIDCEEDHKASNTEAAQIEKISAKVNDKLLLFNPNDIDYFESVEGKCYVNVRHDSFVCNKTLDELETQLRRYGFFRCHRSYLVNMQKVVEVVKWTRNSYSLKLHDLAEVRIPLSKGRIDEMKDLYHF